MSFKLNFSAINNFSPYFSFFFMDCYYFDLWARCHCLYFSLFSLRLAFPSYMFSLLNQEKFFFNIFTMWTRRERLHNNAQQQNGTIARKHTLSVAVDSSQSRATLVLADNVFRATTLITAQQCGERPGELLAESSKVFVAFHENKTQRKSPTKNAEPRRFIFLSRRRRCLLALLSRTTRKK